MARVPATRSTAPPVRPSSGASKVGTAPTSAGAFARCRGSSFYGYRINTQINVRIYGPCTDAGLITLAAAHEMGHVLGLQDSASGCSVMSTRFAGEYPRTRPGGCPAGRDYLANPVQGDDRAGALAVFRSRYTLPGSLCHPDDEQPLSANDVECKYFWDCRGVDGDNVDQTLRLDVLTSLMIVRCPSELRLREVQTGRAERRRRARGAMRVRTRSARWARARAVARRAKRIRGAARARRRRATGRRLQALGRYEGPTSQGLGIRLEATASHVRILSIGVEFSCADGSSRRFSRPHPLNPYLAPGDRVFDLEGLGPFPEVARLSDGGFGQVFEDLSGFARYVLVGAPGLNVWAGNFRVIERWSTQGGYFAPDPEGSIVCDTGPQAFVAEPVATGASARRSAIGSSPPRSVLRRLRCRSGRC
jgi:hypothetical protein